MLASVSVCSVDNQTMTQTELLDWLRETNEERLKELYRLADEVRHRNVGDEVHLRGLIEFSNICVRQCAYCGLRAGNRKLRRYRMTADEMLDCARRAVAFGYGTVVLQSGEDPGIETEWMAQVIRRIKAETPLAVTLSLGERGEDDFQVWRRAGADRYLLRFETSNRALFERIHPSLPGKHSDRFALLRQLRKLGYEAGSGVMIGIPGQTYEDLARDIEWFRQLDLDMIGVGPYLPHPGTPLGQAEARLRASDGEQVPHTEAMGYKVVALTRLVCPKTNIPSTTALATLNQDEGRELGLLRGGNVIMPNVTPPAYRALYEIYPSKACMDETDDFHTELHRRIEAIGRTVGEGRGDSPNWRQRHF